MNQELKIKIDSLDVTSISKDRQLLLSKLASAIQVKIKKKEIVNLVFVCTHNSRRSQFSQIWAHRMAAYFEMPSIFAYSAGTEATAVYSSVLETLKGDCYFFQKLEQSENPRYLLKFEENSYPAICFSKTLDDRFNPKSNFIAVMTCSEADKGCPIVNGATDRISIPFEDPKSHDATSLEKEAYHNASTLIATELKFVFSNLNYSI